MKFPRSFRQKAFSLTELLVATVLVLILAALLLPALNMMRERERNIACTQNLKQIGVAAAAFAADNQNALVPYALNQPHVMQKYRNAFWYGILFYYIYPDRPWIDTQDSLGTPRLKPFFCPSNSTLYAINRTCGWANVSNPAISPLKNFLRIGQGIGEKAHRNVESPGWITSWRPFPLPGGLAQTAFFADGSAAFTPENVTLKFLHNSQCNVLYMDGHVGAITDPDFTNNPELFEERHWINFFGRRRY